MKIIKANSNTNYPAFDVAEVETLGLKDMQDMVGGLIECLHMGYGVDCWLNDEGKLLGLSPNFFLVNSGSIIDVVCGDVFFASSNEEGETIGLTDEQVDWLLGILSERVAPVLIDDEVAFIPCVEFPPTEPAQVGV